MRAEESEELLEDTDSSAESELGPDESLSDPQLEISESSDDEGSNDESHPCDRVVSSMIVGQTDGGVSFGLRGWKTVGSGISCWARA